MRYTIRERSCGRLKIFSYVLLTEHHEYTEYEKNGCKDVQLYFTLQQECKSSLNVSSYKNTDANQRSEESFYSHNSGPLINCCLLVDDSMASFYLACHDIQITQFKDGVGGVTKYFWCHVLPFETDNQTIERNLCCAHSTSKMASALCSQCVQISLSPGKYN